MFLQLLACSELCVQLANRTQLTIKLCSTALIDATDRNPNL